MALDTTAYDPILKEHYVKKKIHELADLGRAPFLAMVPKNTKAGGKRIVQPIDYDNPSGGSATIAKAITNAGNSQYEDFQLTVSTNYQIANIDNLTIESSQTDENAFKPAIREIDKAFKAAGRRDAWQIYRTKGGAKGQVANTSYATTVLTLIDKADAFNFQKGDVITADTVDGGGTEHSGTLTVDSLQREDGTVTMTANLSTGISAIATNDYLFAEGDYDGNIAGLASWLPAGSGRSTALSTAFYGVTRSTDADRLGGIYRDSSGEPLDEALQKLTASVVKHGGQPDCVFMNPETLSDLELLLGAKVRYGSETVAGIGFEHIKVSVAGRTLKLYGDVNCPSNRMYVLQMDTWTLHSVGPTPHFLQRDSLLLRSATADTYEVRVGGYRQLGCSAPSFNGVAALS